MKKKKWLCFLTALCLTLTLNGTSIGSAATTTTATATSLRDLSGHWSQAAVTKAMQAGWVSGYEDSTFRPEKTVTRAEFVKMLAAATGLSPNTATAKWLVSTNYENLKTKLTDVDTHWLAKNGYYQPAVSFGYIMPADYAGGKFSPDRTITRQEIAVMVDRALGVVYQALHEQTGNVPFADYNALPDWLKGYVEQAYQAGVLSGYPDGTVGTNRTATRAEAVAMIQRAIDKMNVGLHPEIKVVYPAEKLIPARKVPLTQPVQIIDDIVYLPLHPFYPNGWWNPQTQGFEFEAGTDFFKIEYVAGSLVNFYQKADYYWDRPVQQLRPHLLNGVLMLPVLNLQTGAVEGGHLTDTHYDAASKTLSVKQVFYERIS